MPRAVIGDELGPIDNYRLRPHDPGPPGPNQVRIAVKAVGVSFVDVLVSQGRYQAKPSLPFIPGSECAGVVEAVGAAVEGVAVGQKVAATGWCGMYADVVNAPAEVVWPMPEGLSFEEAAVLVVSYTTAWHALVDRGALQPGETLLVLGAGGATGLAAVQLGAHLGARVIASASSAAKRAAATAAGAALALDARAPDWAEAVKAACGGKGVDVVFDPVGGAATEQAFRRLGWKGRHLVVGFPGGIAALPTNLPLLKSASLVGVNLSGLAQAEPELAHANHLKVLSLAAEGVIRPVIAQTYRLDQFAQAMADAAQGDSAGRIVLVP
ncbi:NADPH:quinone oxidoreductase family protein [Phenylobacterium sp. LjRoot219]|uniref:NADPH:quinone oxidoreductase family protein n=1 Tax=Phenylobacterium sp. LjRoot219 TaxID=3342283 RepID=UPI003ECCCCA0